MKWMKRGLAVWLAAAMMVTSLPKTAFAQEAGGLAEEAQLEMAPEEQSETAPEAEKASDDEQDLGTEQQVPASEEETISKDKEEPENERGGGKSEG